MLFIASLEKVGYVITEGVFDAKSKTGHEVIINTNIRREKVV